MLPSATYLLHTVLLCLIALYTCLQLHLKILLPETSVYIKFPKQLFLWVLGSLELLEYIEALSAFIWLVSCYYCGLYFYDVIDSNNVSQEYLLDKTLEYRTMKRY